MQRKHATPIKQAIQASGLKQNHIAAKLGIDRFRMSRIVNGHLTANDFEKRHLAKLVRSSVAVLFQDEAA
jgi:predicted XRE-type DNA-binding protein